ncbi:hypothetical protein F5Y06DRAFT_271224 [Hypoxylon sp. FL0890]|nr:hypothetical protein F5Y06DRAFT_271224 [Hypoxylon sp. FL0890]
MACDVDPLGLMDGSRHGIGSPLLSRPDMEPSSRSFDFFDNIHQVRWDASVPEFSIDEGVSSQLVETPLEPVVKFEGANGRLDPHPPLSNNSPVAQPLDWRQATPSSNSSSKRGMCSIQANPRPIHHHLRSTRTSDLQKIHGRASSKRIASQPANAVRRKRGKRRVFRHAREPLRRREMR